MRAGSSSFDQWLEETHSTGFELRRHFFLRFFDSDLVSTPGEWKVVASGTLAILLSVGLIYAQAYYHKYLELHKLDSPEPYRLAILADVLFLVTLAMFVIGLFTTLQWPSLFPSLRDYLALASLPIRMRELFVAKFSALVAFAGLFILATTMVPSLILPAVMAGRHADRIALHIPGIFISCFLGALFVFFSLVAVQGVLLNVLSIRQFARISLGVQAALLMALLCGLPFAASIPSLQSSMSQRPEWVLWVPPFWFLGLEQVIVGSQEPLAIRLAWTGMASLLGAVLAAILAYLWSYRRHRVRLLESPSAAARVHERGIARLARLLLPDPRVLAVFSFIAKGLSRSRQHRLVLTAFVAVAVAIIFEGFATLALRRGWAAFSIQSNALRQAVISAPLALSLFVLAGLRYLFRLPLELRANWVFRVNELGNRLVFLDAMERFVLCCAVLPVTVLCLPLEMRLLGPAQGFGAAILCLLPSLTLMEWLLFQFEKIPFTSSYLPGRRPLVETLIIYGMAVVLYVSLLSGIVSWCLHDRVRSLVLLAVLAAAWIKMRRARLEAREIGKLEFEEVREPAVQTLSIYRD